MSNAKKRKTVRNLLRPELGNMVRLRYRIHRQDIQFSEEHLKKMQEIVGYGPDMRLELVFDGYGSDPKLWVVIPEIRAWFAEVLKACPEVIGNFVRETQAISFGATAIWKDDPSQEDGGTLEPEEQWLAAFTKYCGRQK